MRLVLLPCLMFVLVSCGEHISYSGDEFVKYTTQLGQVKEIERCTIYPLRTFPFLPESLVVYDCEQIVDVQEYMLENDL